MTSLSLLVGTTVITCASMGKHSALTVTVVFEHIHPSLSGVDLFKEHSLVSRVYIYNNTWANARDFTQCTILTCVDSDEPVQPPLKLRNSKWWSVSSLTLIEYSSDKQRLWSDCAYAQAGLSLCWSHIPKCWKSHATAHIFSSIKTCSVLFVVFFRKSQHMRILYVKHMRPEKVQINCAVSPEPRRFAHIK